MGPSAAPGQPADLRDLQPPPPAPGAPGGQPWGRMGGRGDPPGEGAEERISLSDRFGLWVAFHPFTQTEYLEIVQHWLYRLGASGRRPKRSSAPPCSGPAAGLAQRPHGLAVRPRLGGARAGQDRGLMHAAAPCWPPSDHGKQQAEASRLIADSGKPTPTGRPHYEHRLHRPRHHGPPHGPQPAACRPRALCPRPASRIHGSAGRGRVHRLPQPAEAARQSDVVFTMVSDTGDVEQVILARTGSWRGYARVPWSWT